MFVLRDYQQEAVDLTYQRLAEGHRPIVCAPTGCHQRGTPIMQPNGVTKRVEYLNVGDRVMGPDSKPRTIIRLHRGFDEMYRVIPVKGDTFIVNGGHVLSLKTTNVGSSAAGRIENITVRDWVTRSNYYRHTRKLYRVPLDFEQHKGEMPISPYFVGVLLGDGDTKHGRVAVCTADPEIVQEIRQQARIFSVQARKVAAGGISSSYMMTRPASGGMANQLLNAVREIGIDKGCAMKRVPWQYKTATKEARLEVLAGLMDTDGHFNRGGYDYVSKSWALASDVMFIARSVGLAAYMRKCRKSCGDFSGDYYRVSISGNCSIIPCKIARKSCAKRRQKKDVLVTGFKVESLGVGPYYGFECDGDHLYVMGDFTVTHNSGKTVIAGQMARDFMEQGKRVMFLSGRREILRQSYDVFADFCGHDKVGFLMAGESPWWFYPPVTVASQDTLKARWDKADSWRVPADVVMYDECHLSLSPKMVKTVIPFYGDKVNVGFSATPAKQSGKGLGSHYTRIIQVRSVNQLVDAGHLAPCEYWAGSHADVSGLRTVNGDYENRGLSRAANDNVLIGDVVDNWLRIASERHTIVFAVDIAHAVALTEKFQAAGIDAEVLHSRLAPETRTQISDDFKRGDIQVLINVGIATYGYDVPSVSCVVLARPTKSIVLHLQMIGRGMRPKADGGHCVVLDHADNVRRLGAAEDEIRWCLDDGRTAATNVRKQVDEKTKRGDSELTTCDDCGHMFNRSRICPKCGWEKPLPAKDIETVRADLVKYREPKDTKATGDGWPNPENFYRMLMHHAMVKGYKPGWAYHKFREQMDSEPERHWQGLLPIKPTPRVANWIRSQQIRYAKRKKRRAAA